MHLFFIGNKIFCKTKCDMVSYVKTVFQELLSMKNFTVANAAKACGAEIYGNVHEDALIGEIIIDSRLVKPGDIFVAYKGERVDGHDYIATAFDKGAVCCLAQRVPEGVDGCVLVVDDVQSALEEIAAAYREYIDIPIVGITGSVGKTTAKEMISAVLSRRFSVLKTDKNLNNQIGVPMTLSRIGEQHQAAVVEMGISGFGEMTVLAKMVRPTVAVFTYIGHAHLEFLHDLEGVFRAKTEMLSFVAEDGVVVVNGDDALLNRVNCPQRVIRYGMGEHCDVRSENVSVRNDGTIDCEIVFDTLRLPVHIPSYGQHMVYAALEGAAVGIAMGLSADEIKEGIAEYKTVGRRGAVTDTGKILLVDDCYNSNPDSLKCAMDSLTLLPGRHVCVLSDMLEQGENAAQIHRDAGLYAAGKGVELLVAYGPLSAHSCEAMGERGVHFETKQQLLEALPGLIREGDSVLVKASLGMHLEDASELLKTL